MVFTFNLAQTTKNFLHQICLSINLKSKEGSSYYFKIPFYISQQDWDYEKQRPKNIYCKKHKDLNSMLIAVKLQLIDFIEKESNYKKGISRKKISDEINKICHQKQQQYPQDSLLSLLCFYLNSKQYTVRLSTYRRYIVFMRLIEKFEGYMGKRIYIKDVDTELIRTFHSFGKAEAYTGSTINRSIHFIKTILNFAEKKGFKTEIRNLEMPKSNVQNKVIILNEQEILKINNTSVPQELQAAKDWLLISCYTGQRISDFMRFNIGQLINLNGTKCISFIQQKTGKEIIIPLHPIVLTIVKKNGNSFPKQMDISLYNNHLKKIAELAQINDNIKAKKRAGYRSREIQTEKWKAISSHVGRRSFASNFYGKIPTPLLMQATGHSSEKMFLNYINPVNYERIASLGAYFEKIHAERR